MELDELQFKLDKELCESSVEELVKLAVYFEWGEEKYTGKSRLALMRLLRRDIEEKTAQIEDGNSCRTFIENTRAELGKKKDTASTESQVDQTSNKEIENLKQQPSSLEENHLKTSGSHHNPTTLHRLPRHTDYWQTSQRTYILPFKC